MTAPEPKWVRAPTFTLAAASMLWAVLVDWHSVCFLTWNDTIPFRSLIYLLRWSLEFCCEVMARIWPCSNLGGCKKYPFSSYSRMPSRSTQSPLHSSFMVTFPLQLQSRFMLISSWHSPSKRHVWQLGQEEDVGSIKKYPFAICTSVRPFLVVSSQLMYEYRSVDFLWRPW